MNTSTLPLLSLLSLLSLSSLLSYAAEPAFTVTALPLGPDNKRESTPDGIGTFVSRLDAREGWSAALAPKPSPKWDQPPEGVKPERWISLVPAGFGARTDWLAFAFDETGRPLCAVRRPARQWDTAGIYPENIPPGDRQIDRNAGIELAADLGFAWPAADPKADRLRIGLAEPEAAATEALAMMPSEREGLRALAAAAGLQASGLTGSWQLSAVKFENGYKLELRRPGAKPVAARAPREAVFPVLVRLIRSTAAGWPAADFILADPGGARLLGWRDEKAYLETPEGVIAFPAADGAAEWTASIESKYHPAYTWGPWSAGDAGRAYSYHPQLSPVSEDGAIPKGPGADESMPWGFDRLPDVGYVVAQGPELIRTEPKKLSARWKWSAPDRLTAGPLVAGDAVLAGGLAGDLTALSLADGQVLWRTQVTARLSGPMAAAGDIAVAPSLEGGLYGFDRKSGRLVWRAELGDAVLGRLMPAGSGLLAATRDGRMVLVDPAAGRVVASRAFGEEAAGCSVIGDKAVWLGRRGKVAWLALPGLTVLREGNLGTVLKDGAVTAASMPLRWGTGEEIQLRGPAALASDEEGFVYVLPVP